MRRTTWAVLMLNLLAATASCQQQKKEGAELTEASEASSKQPVGKVAQAVANAVGAGTPAAASSGPPPDGILEPARAEAEAPSGRAPKLTIGATGAEPRVALRSPGATLPRTVKVEVTMQAGMGQGLPPIELTIGLDSKRAVPAPSKDDGGKSDSVALSVTAKIRDVKVSMPNVPAEFTAQLSGLKGSKVSFTLAADGGGYGFSSELPPAAKPELRDLLDTATEGLALLTMPVPSEKVGTGAFWMVVSRDKSAGFGLVSYHMVKLTRADEKSPELEFDTHRYAIGRIIDPALLAPGSEPATLKEMSAGVKGRVRLAVDSTVPVSVDADASLQGAFDQGQGSPKRAVQSMSRYRISVAR